ncbi:4-oxalocrotonate tautomerase [Chloroflexota bacterium]
MSRTVSKQTLFRRQPWLINIYIEKEDIMPLVTVDMWEGRTVEQKKELVEGITSAMNEKLGIAPEHITIIIRDVPKHNWATGGKLASE